MPPSPFDGKRPTQKPLPQCKAFLICERVGVDERTGQFNLHRVVNSLNIPEFPAESPPLAAYFQLYDGIGQYDLSMELRNLAVDTSVSAEILVVSQS